MDWAQNDAWFSHAGALGTIGFVGALICALLAIIFLIKQYKGHPKAPKFTRLFLVLGVLFLLMARFAPQENMALSEVQSASGNSIAQSLEQGIKNEAKAFTAAAEQEIDKVEGYVSGAFTDAKDGVADIIQSDDQEIQALEDTLQAEMDEDVATLDAGLHGNIEAEAEAGINEIVEGDDFSSHMTSGQRSVEDEALSAMNANALEAAREVEGVHSVMWNASILPELQLDVVADVTPESAIPLMNTLCITLSENTVQPTTVSVKDLEGGHIARQMCGVLTQGVD